MEIKETDNKEKWDNFLKAREKSQFLQSFLWGEFKKSLGIKIWRFIIEKDGETKGSSLVLRSPLPFGGSYLYIPRGPNFSLSLNPDGMNQAFNLLINKIKETANRENSIFLKIDPPFEKPSYFHFEKKGFQKSKAINPPETVILDLKKNEDELLKEMHPKTRYNIRLAERKGVEVQFSEKIEDIDLFFKLLSETYKREGITSFPKKYYQKMFGIFIKDRAIKIVKAGYQGKIIVCNLVLYYGDMATYNHGASSSEYRNVMAPHLAQWKSISDAKQKGFKYYDFRGIAPTDDPNHKWAGITRFKKGFAGKVVKYLSGYDYVYKQFLYQMYLMGKKFKL